MQVTVDIPDQFVRDLLPEGSTPEQALLEQAVVNAYREERLTTEQVRVLLGLGTRAQASEMLGRHSLYEYGPEDFEQDVATLDRYLAESQR